MTRQKAFTLIELLVVIAIIAMLLAILMPVIRLAKTRTRTIICQANLRQWGAIFVMNANDNDGYINGDPTLNPNYLWVDFLRPYYRDEKLGICPTAKKFQGDPAAGSFAEGVGGTFTRWHIDYMGTVADGSYGVNTWIYNWVPAVEKFRGRPTKNNWRTISVKGAGKVPLLLDCTWLGVMPAATTTPPEVAGDEFDYGPPKGIQASIRSYCINRHNEHINGLFLDLSVRKVGLKELWELDWHRDWKAGTHIWPDWMKKFKNYADD